jgi:hypothetical protein
MISAQTRRNAENCLQEISEHMAGNSESRSVMEALAALGKGDLRPALGALKRECRRLSMVNVDHDEEDGHPVANLQTLIHELEQVQA